MTVALLFALACTGKSNVDPDNVATPSKAPTEVAAEAPVAVDAAAVLAKADLADGTEDKVVSKCARCALGMAGDPQRASTHEGYELHFCSDSCKTGFEEDPDATLSRLD